MNLKLARKYYNARVTELVEFLEQNNKEFKLARLSLTVMRTLTKSQQNYDGDSAD